MNIHEFENKIEWADAVVEEVIRDLPEENFSLAFSGGSTPQPIYRLLVQQNLNWEKADIFQVDERYIPPHKAESNALLILQNFVEYLEFPAGRIHFFETSGDIPWEESAEQYDRLLREHKKPFDVCILGIGPDGHTASLFPNGPEIYEEERLAITSETNQFAVWKRLTLTFPAILQSKKLIILLKGEEKKETLEELLHGDLSWEDFPVKKFLEHENAHIFFLEKEM